jgi:penicillin-binding protein 1A
MALMTALRRGVDPDSTSYVSKSPTLIDDPVYGKFEIDTYSNRGAGSMSLRRATLASDNSVYIQLAMDLGPDEVKRTARDMGIRSTLKGYPAETLGGLENGVSPLEMATAYASIASGGLRLRPTAIKKIVFPDGRVEKGKDLPPRFRVKKVRIFEEGEAAKATEILEQNMQSGTGTHALIGCPAAGKTGTTDGNTDAWFVGYTPRLTTAVWVGYPKDDIQMNGLYFGATSTGALSPPTSGATTWAASRAPSAATSSRRIRRSSRLRSTASTPSRAVRSPVAWWTPRRHRTRRRRRTPSPTRSRRASRRRKRRGFDPTQYESEPQAPPETQAPADTGQGGGAAAPPG